MSDHSDVRACVVISVIIHAAFVLWLVLGPGARAFDPAKAEPILVDLVPSQDLPREAENDPQKSEESKAEEPKAEESKAEPAKSEPSRSAASEAAKPESPKSPKPEPSKPQPGKPNPEAAQKPAQKNDSKTTADDGEQERAATAARLAWLLDLPTGTVTSLAAPPSENKSNLSSEEIAQFKAQVSKCWVVPSGVPSTPGFDVLLRIALTPDGRLGAAPELIRAPASLAGPPLVDSAKRALQKCQPYGGLPADKYKDWRLLDLTFTAQGPSGLSGPPAGRSAAAR
jgi:type IV secretory pathway VirB10-like protein